MGGNFQFQVQDSDLEYCFWRFGDLKNESHFLKKRHLYTMQNYVIDGAGAILVTSFFLQKAWTKN